MRLSLALLSLAASSVSASLLPRQTIPQCANNCLFGPNVDLDGCGPTDNLCLCKSAPFISTSTSCIESACSGNDLQTALDVAQQLCASVGVTLTSAAPPATSSKPASSSAPASPATTSNAPATTSNAATLHSANAFAGLAAIALAALAL